MAKKTLEKIKTNYPNTINQLEYYKDFYDSLGVMDRNTAIAEIRGYLTALLDLGIISETEKKSLWSWITL